MIGPPAETPDASPAALIVAIPVFDEPHVTVTAPDDPSEKCPVAENCCVAPTATDAVGGATVIEVRVGAVAVTVRLTPGEVTPFMAAVIVVAPTATPVASPRVPATLLIVAKPGREEFHVTEFVKF